MWFHLFSTGVTFAFRQNEGNFACDLLSFGGVSLSHWCASRDFFPPALWVGLHFTTLSDGCPSVCSDNWSAAGDKQADFGKARIRGIGCVKPVCSEFTQPVHHTSCASFYPRIASHTHVTARSATGLGLECETTDRRRRLKIHILHTTT